MKPRFLGGDGYRHFILQFLRTEAPRAHIVYLPPFGEEMNRCRAVVAEQARQFAEKGYSCSLVDFYGTGDSEGVLAEASLSRWHENIRLTVEALQREYSAPVILWGLRLGALIAMDFAAKSSEPVANLLLWQPVTSGKRYVNQLLRQRVAALVDSDQPPETTSEIKARLEAGECVEVSGYTLGARLLDDIERIDIGAMSDLCSGRIFWLENVESSQDALSAASQKAVERLRERSQDVIVRPFTAPPIWQLHKRDEAPDLHAVTADLAFDFQMQHSSEPSGQ